MDLSFAVGDAAEKIGVVVLGCTTALALTTGAGRRRTAAVSGTLVLAAILLVGHIWNNAQFRSISGDATKFTVLLVLGLTLVAALAVLFRRRAEAFPLLAVAALPFRVPIEAGGTTSNLLVPLYLVIAGGVAAFAWDEIEGRREARAPAVSPVRMLRVALAVFVVLYAIQSLYSNDFSNALQQMVFFYVPFALLFVLLAEVDWDRRLLVGCLGVLVALALVFSAIGFWEYDHRELLWNPKVIHANQFSSHFRVNSVFWDPSIFGRFLVIVMLALTAVMIWSTRPRSIGAIALALPVLMGGLVLTLSQSSISALLAGLAALAAVRWNARKAAIATATGLVLAGVFVVSFQGALRIHLGSSGGLNKATSGRGDLIRGGLELFADRPLWGHGSGSFAKTYREEKGTSQQATSASHTIPLTIAAEQGPLGLAAYVFLLVAAVEVLLGRAWSPRRARSRAPPPEVDGAAAGGPGLVARAALVACLAAVVVHTMAYAAFLEDPFTWVILAVGAALASGPALVRAPLAAAGPGVEPAPAAA